MILRNEQGQAGMSEPMTSGEIEDVLSSIRKLVSEDLRPQSRAAARAAPPSPPPLPEQGKLILTPALRVVEGNAEAAASEAVLGAAPRPRLDAVVSTIAAQVPVPPEGWEAETGDATVTRLVRPAPPVDAFPDATTGDDTDPPGTRLHFMRPAELDEDEADAQGALPAEGEDPSFYLDAEGLADLVRDILRAELQGPMGERMTRNIRKLVRAEVARMLAARDLA
jgi:hypothetical protein